MDVDHAGSTTAQNRSSSGEGSENEPLGYDSSWTVLAQLRSGELRDRVVQSRGRSVPLQMKRSSAVRLEVGDQSLYTL